jgi:hypothetical protein
VYKLDEYDETLEKIYDYQRQLVKIIYESSPNIGLEQFEIDELCKKIKKEQDSLCITLTNRAEGIVDDEFTGRAFVEFKEVQQAHDCYNRFCKSGFCYKVFGMSNYGSKEELILDYGVGQKKRVFVEDHPGGEINNQDKAKLTNNRGHFEALPIAIDINWEYFSNVSPLQRKSKKVCSVLALGLLIGAIGAAFMGTAIGFGKVINGGGSSKKVQSQRMMLGETQSQPRQLFRKRIELDIGQTSSAIQLATLASSKPKPKAKPAHGSKCLGSLCITFGETKTSFLWKTKSKSSSKTTKPSKSKDEIWSTIVMASIIALVLFSNKIIKSSILALTYYEKNYTLTETVDRVEKRTVWLQFLNMTVTPV